MRMRPGWKYLLHLVYFYTNTIPVFKAGLILESIFNFVSLEKIFVKSLFIFFSAYSGKFRDSYFEHLFEDETKLTILSMIMPPLPKLIELNGHKWVLRGVILWKIDNRYVPLNFQFKEGTTKKWIILFFLESGIEEGQERPLEILTNTINVSPGPWKGLRLFRALE